MSVWNIARGTRPKLPPTPLERRIAALSTSELYTWLDTTLAGIGRLANDARRTTNSPLLLQEAEEGAVAVQAVLRELQSR